MTDDARQKSWLPTNGVALLTVAVILLYALFVHWFWGWGQVLAAWQEIGIAKVLLALCLLVGTYFIRAHRMQDYFPSQTRGQFLRLLRVTQIHNILNIMLPFRAGETSFPLLMRSEFGVPLAHGASALLVLRLLDLHALLAAAGAGVIAASGNRPIYWTLWLLFLVAPLGVAFFRDRLVAMVRGRLPARISGLVDQAADGIPRDVAAFFRAWLLTVANWGIKVLVLAWILHLMDVSLVGAFGGALGGELSSVLPVHAPGGVGTYPAAIAAGAAAFGAVEAGATAASLAKASINTHLLMIVSALAGTGISLILPGIAAKLGRATRR